MHGAQFINSNMYIVECPLFSLASNGFVHMLTIFVHNRGEIDMSVPGRQQHSSAISDIYSVCLQCMLLSNKIDVSP